MPVNVICVMGKFCVFQMSTLRRAETIMQEYVMLMCALYCIV